MTRPATLLAAILLIPIPAAAGELERSVAMMARIGSAYAPSFSPDAKQVAFITNISGSPQVWTVPVPSGYPRQVTALDDPVTGARWSPDGTWIALEVAPGGGLNSQIYVVRPDGTDLRQLTPGGKENNRLGRWTPDSKALIISSNRRDSASIDTWLLDIGTAQWRLLAESGGISWVHDVSLDGKYALIGRLRSRGDNDVYRVSLESGEEIHLTPHKPPATFGDAMFGPSADLVYLAGNPSRDRSALIRVRITGGKGGRFEPLMARDDADLVSLALDHTRRVGLLNWNVGGRNELTKFTIQPYATTRGPSLPAEIVSDVEFAPSGPQMAFVLSGSALPADIWLSTDFQTVRQLTLSPHPGVDLSALVRPKPVTYEAEDGLELSGWLYRPRGASPPYPTVFSFHGGPEGQERPTFNTTYQALLAKGIAVFAPNVRGSAGFGKRFVNLDNGPLRAGSIRDIKASVDHLVRRGIADPGRLGIMGGSYGGYMVMAGVTEFPELFAAGANLFGIVNFETFFSHSEPWMAAISTVEYGDPATQRDMLRALSPIHKIDRIQTPLLVLHGANDTNVPVIEAEQTVESLRKRNVPVEYILFPDEGHGWRKLPNRIRSAASIVRFFTERLGGEAGPAEAPR
ncbi:MAG TPA: S9 family peptidase [Thermoanaerobaculia bacterium]|nr:S9 family peptidase [Thermoanaerobaculia bacterium]